MSPAVITSLIYTGVCIAFFLFRQVISTFSFPMEMESLLRQLLLMLPVCFLAPFLTEIIFRENPAHSLFQKVLYRILIAAAFFTVLDVMVEYVYEQIWHGSYNQFTNLKEVLLGTVLSLPWGIYRACMYYVVHMLVDKHQEMIRTDVVDR